MAVNREKFRQLIERALHKAVASYHAALVIVKALADSDGLTSKDHFL